MELNGQKLDGQATQKIVDTLKNPRKASKELKQYIKEAIEVSNQVKRQ